MKTHTNQAEHERLLDLLGAYDAERAALQRDRQALEGELAALRAAPPPEGGDQGKGDATGAEAAHLAVELEAERGRRRRAEQDFADLLQASGQGCVRWGGGPGSWMEGVLLAL